MSELGRSLTAVETVDWRVTKCATLRPMCYAPNRQSARWSCKYPKNYFLINDYTIDNITLIVLIVL